MSEQRPGAGGPANTPPFPRLVQDDERAGGKSQPTASSEPSDPLHIHSDPAADAETRQNPITERLKEPGPKAGEQTSPPDDQGEAEAGEADLGDLVAGRSVNRGLQNAADQLEDLAERLESVAALGETRGAAGLASVARKSSAVLGDSATYLRSTDIREMRGDLEAQVRTSPLKTLLIAVAAGWVVGKIVR